MKSCTTHGKPIEIAREIQIDNNSSSKIGSPIYLKAAHQKTQRPDPANPINNLSDNRFNNAIFYNVAVEKYYSKIDGIRYPKDAIMINCNENNYPNQYRDLKLFYQEFFGESLLSLVIP